ncbi:MAG: cation:dicarboxylase symporter family transporter, partial [Prevotella sp.]|nr:cation:dicarboxylase symporter family transporter [Prevotella sp.]
MAFRLKISLLPRIIIAIILGIVFGNVFSLPWVRVFTTFNAVFSQFLGFMIPLIIVGLVTPAIADIGKSAGKLLLITVAIAYLDTVISGILSYGTGSWLFPAMVEKTANITKVEEAVTIAPYFTIQIPPIIEVMSGLVFSFMMGLTIAYGELHKLKGIFDDFKTAIVMAIHHVIIPLLPLYIFGIFLQMTYTGQAYHIMLVFIQIIIVIFALH